MRRFHLISALTLLAALSCKTVDCGTGTIEKDGKCIVDNKENTISTAPGEGKKWVQMKNVNHLTTEEAKIKKAKEQEEEEAKKIYDEKERKKTIEELQVIVDEKIQSWQSSWTRTNNRFGVTSAKGTVTDFEIGENMSILVLVDISFQFTYGKRVLTRSCSSSDFCSGDFKEGQNKAKVVMTFDKMGYDLVYSSHFIK